MAKVRPDLPQDADGDGVLALPGRLDHGAGDHLMTIALARQPLDCSHATERLSRAAHAVAALGAARLEDDAPGVASVATQKAQGLAIHDDAGAQPRAHGQRHEPACAAPAAEVIFGQGVGGEVVVEHHRQAIPSLQRPAQVDAAQGRRAGTGYRPAALSVDVAVGGDADAHDFCGCSGQ